MKISFQSGQKAQPLTINIENQVKQVMRENYAAMENEIIDNSCQKIKGQFFDDFQNAIRKTQNEIGKKDLVNILTTLKSAYFQAGLTKDAEVLDTQIKQIDLQG